MVPKNHIWQVSRLKFLEIQALPGTSQLFPDIVRSTPLLDVATNRCVLAWHRSAWAQQFNISEWKSKYPRALLFLRRPTFFAQTFSRSSILTENGSSYVVLFKIMSSRKGGRVCTYPCASLHRFDSLVV
jgi:hypothetical protein